MGQVRIPWKGWVVVCDGAKALFFRNDGDAEILNLTTVDVLAQSLAPTRDLGTDRPGRVRESVGQARSAVETPDLHAEAETTFLVSIAEKIGKAVREHEIGHLTLVAPPRALGVLRKHLSPAAQAAIRAEVSKDLAGLSTPEIEKHLAA